MRRRKTAGGFTLIELMVVVALIAIGAALVAWGFGSQRPRQQLAGAANEIQALVHGARQSALATGRRTIVVIFPDYRTSSNSKGRLFVVEDDMAEEFFVTANGNATLGSLDELDPSRTGAIVMGSGADGGVLDTMDLPPGVTFGPATGMGSSAKTSAPYDIPLDAACTFCTGQDNRGAIAFDPSGRATFWDANGRSPLTEEEFQRGASLTLMADDVSEVRTLVVVASTGAMQTLSLVVP